MLHLPELIQDLGFILIIAAIVTLIFKKLGQPVVLGYLIAGFLVSPHVPFMPTIQDTNSIKVWAEIGVIFLLFGLGLEFSFKKLAQVGRSATITAVVEIAFMLGLGFVAGRLLGWSSMDSLFLGGILSISSTTIIVRAFDELGLKGRSFVSLVFGVLVVEDIVAILLLVLLSTVAVTQGLSGKDLLFSGARLGFFLLLWFALGIYFLSPALKKIRHLLNQETLLVVSIGLCLLMVLLATKVGFSPALGAFVMGSLLAETKEGKTIEHLIHPVRDLFAAIFFVSVGMLIDPKVLLNYAPELIFITLLTIVGKFLSSGMGALVSGNSLKQSVQAGMSLAQIGEFSFIIATLGMSLKVTSDFLYPIAVAVSAITTFTTPYLIRCSDPFYHFLEKNISPKTQQRLERYRSALNSEGIKAGIFKLFWMAYGWRMLLSSIFVLAIFLLGKNLVPYAGIFPEAWVSPGIALLCAGLSVPFLWAIAFGESKAPLTEVNKNRLAKLQIGFSFFRLSFTLAIALLSLQLILPIPSIAAFVLLAGLTVVVSLGRHAAPVYGRLEQEFVKNLEDKKDEKQVPTLVPWDADLADFILHPNSFLVGKSLQDSKLKENFGITIALIQRGEEQILAPDRNWVLMPQDRLFVIGTEEALVRVKENIERPMAESKHKPELENFGLRSIMLETHSDFVSKAIRESGLREKISGLIVGIEREGQRILSPDSSIVLQAGDTLWVVGDLEKIRTLKK